MRLTTEKAGKAARYNIRYARAVGWSQRYPQLASVFGVGPVSLTPEGFSQYVADWQAANKPLTVDGMLGRTTWSRLDPLTRFSTAPVPAPAWLPTSQPATPPRASAPRAGSGPLWMQVAEAQRQRWNNEIGEWVDQTRRSRAERFLDWDEQYFAASPMWGGVVHSVGERPSTERNLHWCAAFVNYCLHRAGYSHTGSAGAGSFIRPWWRFEALEEPRAGCVIVVGGTSPAHVAFLHSFSGLPSNPGGDVRNTRDVTIRLLGGNQSNRITISSDGRNLLAARGQNGVTSPYLWPHIGSPNCNVDVPTERPHYCRFIHT